MAEEIKINVSDPSLGIDDPLEEIKPASDGLGSTGGNLIGSVGNLTKQVVRLQFGLLTLPFNLLPSRSRYHAKNALHEGFLSLKVLLDELSTGIDEGLRASLEHDKAWADTASDEIIPPTPDN
jgi:hypothetical protein